MFRGYLKRKCILMLDWVFKKCQPDPICWWCSVLQRPYWFSAYGSYQLFLEECSSLQLYKEKKLYFCLFLLSVLSDFASLILKVCFWVHIHLGLLYCTEKNYHTSSETAILRKACLQDWFLASVWELNCKQFPVLI